MMEEVFDDEEDGDSTETMLHDIIPPRSRKFRFQYEYDFGDSWMHEIAVEGLIQAEPGVEYPLCLEGARAGPPEDCGGVWGYANLLERWQNRKGQEGEEEEDEEDLNWLGEDFDPEKFDPAAATEAMRAAWVDEDEDEDEDEDQDEDEDEDEGEE